MKTKAIFGMLLAMGMFLVNCTEPPPLPPDDKKPPVDGQIPPSETGKPPARLVSSGQVALPRGVHALFVDGNTSYTCTPEGALYKVKVKDMRRFTLTAVDVTKGKAMWEYKGSACVFRSDGQSLYVVRDMSKAKGQIAVERLDSATGKVQGRISIQHSGCKDQEKSGVGERMFATSSGRLHSCFEFDVSDGKLLFSNQSSVQLFNAKSGALQWKYEVNGDEARIVSAFVKGDVAYVMEGVKEIAEGAVAPPNASSNVDGAGLSYQLRAVRLGSKETRWVVGPFPAPTLQARISMHGDALIVQALSASKKEELLKASPGLLLQTYAENTWKASVHTFSFNPTSGESKWSKPSTRTFTKGNRPVVDKKSIERMPMPTLTAPLQMKDLLLFLAPGSINLVSAPTGNLAWSFGTGDITMSQGMVLDNTHVFLRSSDGHPTLLELKSDGPPEFTSSQVAGALLYAVDGIAPGTDAAAKKKSPKRRFSAKGLCLKVGGGPPVPMSEMSTFAGFFMPPPSSYGDSRSFSNAFCARFLIEVEEKSMDGKKSIWKSAAFVEEAPVFFFVRGTTLVALSDNGDWYQFSLR